MTSILHACPYCGYETEIVNALPAFSENPHCQQCGLSVMESNCKVDHDLAALFARQMVMVHGSRDHTPIPPATPATLNPSDSPMLSDPPPIAYSITQHYHHSSHQAMDSQRPKLDVQRTPVQARPSIMENMPPNEILARHNINPGTLLPSQLTLFEQADIDQKARLLELWQISPSTFGNISSLQASNSAVTSAAHNQGCNKYDATNETPDFQSDITMDEDSADSYDMHHAEPYVVSGYEVLARREYDASAQPQSELSVLPINPPTDVYKASTDPAYKKEDWWQSSEPVEHQYGAFEMKNYYIGCGVARPHWLEDQPMF
ncbi:predicted protein [Uncinocarpus reesii 1704]|uniref:Uncharacterized protein n=1 Tax=Uncinocarpus reesii (strain UAMH 1704) TaxID=336963 RepID=C4K074_UNCRE|nr:uncharacterized protein UREG_07825 [Uncinocarpus reesii 1704]EEP82960.1 predicted protein [Uncinocarpus reesii 1704]